MSGTDARREGDVGDVQGIPHVEMTDIEAEGFGQIVGQTGDFHGVDVLFEQTASLDADGFTDEVSRDVGGDGGIFVNGQKVCMQRLARQRIVVDGLQERQTSPGTFDFEVDQDIFRTALGEHFGERFGMHLEVLIFGAPSVNDRREPAFAAHLIESAGTGAGSHGCLEGLLGGHIREGVLCLKEGMPELVPAAVRGGLCNPPSATCQKNV